MNPGFIELKKSLIKREIHHHIINVPWQGFYTKVSELGKYASSCDADYILFVDAHDVIFTGPLDYIKESIPMFGDVDAIFSAEKGCWPDASLESRYEKTKYPWRFLNSGSFLFKPSALANLIKEEDLFVGMDDQLYYTEKYLDKKMNAVLDLNCEIFQSVSHDSGESFSIEDGMFKNVITGTYPVVIHGNGKTPLTEYIGL